ncbi:carboxymuconolactone decarboxylase family protein [Pseudonocardia acaciae]|uniref:carboxymuconolactone decarboxylase family protein n=1 Tax=Pseudonocardia acaciae TaxID=551276 RepID=UPI00048BF356|nr:carboxymuconolactone decarboxylase family protein [Pseudonocardia acaciae]
MTPRIEPLSEPYTPEVAERLRALMPGGGEPIRLFRTFVRNLPMAAGLNAWGGYYLSRQLSLTMRERELVIDRTTARCGCDYEWGVHIAVYGERVGLTPDQIGSIAHGAASDPCWDAHDALVIEAVDALHDTATIGDDLWGRLAGEFTEAQLLDLLLLTGWYHAISFAANAAGVEPEDWAPRLADAR